MHMFLGLESAAASIGLSHLRRSWDVNVCKARGVTWKVFVKWCHCEVSLCVTRTHFKDCHTKNIQFDRPKQNWSLNLKHFLVCSSNINIFCKPCADIWMTSGKNVSHTQSDLLCKSWCQRVNGCLNAEASLIWQTSCFHFVSVLESHRTTWVPVYLILWCCLNAWLSHKSL